MAFNVRQLSQQSGIERRELDRVNTFRNLSTRDFSNLVSSAQSLKRKQNRLQANRRKQQAINEIRKEIQSIRTELRKDLDTIDKARNIISDLVTSQFSEVRNPAKKLQGEINTARSNVFQALRNLSNIENNIG